MSRNVESRERIAVVAGVGSVSGLGAALARRFAREGLLVFIAGRSKERLERVAAQIMAERGKAVAVATDVTSEKDAIRLLSSAEDSGHLDLVVYNAGSNVATSLLQLKRSEFESLWKQAFSWGARPSGGCFPIDVDLHRRHGLHSGAPSIHGIRVGQSCAEGGCARLCTRVRAARHPRRPCNHRWRHPGRLRADAVRGSRSIEGQRRPS